MKKVLCLVIVLLISCTNLVACRQNTQQKEISQAFAKQREEMVIEHDAHITEIKNMIQKVDSAADLDAKQKILVDSGLLEKADLDQFARSEKDIEEFIQNHLALAENVKKSALEIFDENAQKTIDNAK
jgi:hypothetical protein